MGRGVCADAWLRGVGEGGGAMVEAEWRDDGGWIVHRGGRDAQRRSRMVAEDVCEGHCRGRRLAEVVGGVMSGGFRNTSPSMAHEHV